MTSDQSQLEVFNSEEIEDWQEVVFSNVININEYPSAEKGAKYKSVGVSDIIGDRRKIQNWEVKEYSYSRPRFRNGQTLLARITPCLENGKTSYVDVLDEDETAIGSTEFIILSDTERTTPKFVYYTVRRPEIRQFAIKRMTGTSGRQRVPLDIFDDKKIQLPPLDTQKRITSTLDYIDTKIEVNNRINEILEELVQCIFKQRFVDFHPYTNFKEADIGEIPDNFDVVEIASLCTEIQNGGTPNRSNSEYWEGDIPWIKTGELNNGVIAETEEAITEKGLEENNCFLADENTVLVALYGASVGALGITKIPATFNQACCSLKAKPSVGHAYLYQSLKTLKPKLKQLSRGSAQQNISQGIVKEQKYVLPPEEELRKFREQVNPMYDRIGKNLKENVILDRIRDTLLPKLMSGEIRVNDISLDDLEVDNEV